MSTNYPGALDDGTVFPTRNGNTATVGAHVNDHNNLKDAVIAIETELGVQPSGVYASVVARLLGMGRSGDLASRGDAGDHTGSRYLATDIGAEYLSDGTNWIRTSAPAGETVYFPGLTLPAGLIRKTGVDVSRTGIYAELFEAITRKVSGSGNSGQAVLTVGAGVGEGLVTGMKVEGTGVPVGATILSFTATTITLSANLTTSGARDIRIFPHGNGNGSTTFGIPDGKGRGSVGRDNMGGVLASDQLTSDVTRRVGGAIGKTGGEMTHQLVQGAMPPHDHGGTATAGGSHTHTASSNNSTPDSLSAGGQASFHTLYTNAHEHSMQNHNHSASGSTSISADNAYGSAAVSGGAGVNYGNKANATHTHSASTSVSIGGMSSMYGSAYGTTVGSGAVGITQGQNNHHHYVYILSAPNHTHPIPRSGSASGTVNSAKGDAHENMHPHMVEDNCLRL